MIREISRRFCQSATCKRPIIERLGYPHHFRPSLVFSEPSFVNSKVHATNDGSFSTKFSFQNYKNCSYFANSTENNLKNVYNYNSIPCQDKLFSKLSQSEKDLNKNGFDKSEWNLMSSKISNFENIQKILNPNFKTKFASSNLINSNLENFFHHRSFYSFKNANYGLNLLKQDIGNTCRHFSANAPVHLQRKGKIQIYVQSPGIIAEPYNRNPPQLSVYEWCLTRKGWKQIKETFINFLKTAYTLAKLRQKKTFTQKQFYEDMANNYIEINKSFANSNLNHLRHFVTEKMFSLMKKEVKIREDSGIQNLKFEILGPVKILKTAQARMIGVEEKKAENAFVQITLIFQSTQKFVGYDKNGKVVVGDPDKEFKVEDIWVFERHFLRDDLKWRLCGKI